MIKQKGRRGDKTSITRICAGAFAIRLIVLSLVVFFSDNLTTGFLSSDIVNDDVRYQVGAEIYASRAKSIIDANAIGNAYLEIGDWSVYGGGEFKLWYWIVAVFTYIFHSHVGVRILNIIFAVISVKCIYDISKKLGGEKIAKVASALYAFMPYPVFFSCFLYKDQFYTLLILLIFRIILLKGVKLSLWDIVKVVLLILVSTFIRSGLSVLIAAIAAYLYVHEKGIRLSKVQIWLMFALLALGVVAFINISLNSIDYKYAAYVLDYKAASEGTVSMLNIKSIDQIYKFPFALFFMMLLPVATPSAMGSWLGVVGWLNIVAMPIALGSFFYLFYKPLEKSRFFWCIQSLYLVTIVTSLGIFRHSYYLQPYMMMFFASFYLSIKSKSLFAGVSAILTVFYTMVLFFR